MVYVSKNKLKPKVNKNVTGQFINTIASLDDATARVFFKEFFTEAERLLFAKRLAVIYLLRKGVTPSSISKLLKVSRVTVYSIKKSCTPAERDAIITAYERFESGNGLLSELHDLIFKGFSMSSKKRTEWLNEFEKRAR